MNILKVIVIFGSLLYLTGCYYDVERELYPVGPSLLTDTTKVTYAVDIKPIIDNNCIACHVPGTARVNLTNYAGVKQVADNGLIKQKVIIEKSMPPSGPLPSDKIQLLQRWLDLGSPEN